MCCKAKVYSLHVLSMSVFVIYFVGSIHNYLFYHRNIFLNFITIDIYNRSDFKKYMFNENVCSEYSPSKRPKDPEIHKDKLTFEKVETGPSKDSREESRIFFFKQLFFFLSFLFIYDTHREREAEA